MAGEWVSPVAGVTGAAVGAVTTWLTARDGRKHAETIAMLNNEHAARLGDEARKQRRIEETYVGLLALIENYRRWAVATLYKFDGLRPLEPVAEDTDRAASLARSFGSPEVYGDVQALWNIISRIRTASRTEFDRRHPEASTLLKEFDAKRDTIGRQVAKELQRLPWMDRKQA